MTHDWDITSEETYAEEAIDFTDEVEAFKDLLGAQIFGATFEKRDGTMRTGAFRLRVTKDITGTGSSYDRAARGNITCWDLNRGGYRTIRLASIQSLRFRGKEIDLL